jgi:hypothetical protein
MMEVYGRRWPIRGMHAHRQIRSAGQTARLAA